MVLRNPSKSEHGRLTEIFINNLLSFNTPEISEPLDSSLPTHRGFILLLCDSSDHNDILVERHFRPVGIPASGVLLQGSFLRNFAEHGDLPLYSRTRKTLGFVP